MIKNRLFFVPILALFVSCTSQNGQEVIREDAYYDLVGLLDQQISHLVDSKANLEKTMKAGDASEVVQMAPDTAVWKEELKLFYNANINKLGLGDAYDVEQLSRVGGGSKLINAAKSESQAVRLIEYNFDNDMLESLRILVEERNEVYVFKKEMEMFFDQGNENPVLREYTITGTQSMVMKSDLNFSLKGKIVLNP